MFVKDAILSMIDFISSSGADAPPVKSTSFLLLNHSDLMDLGLSTR